MKYISFLNRSHVSYSVLNTHRSMLMQTLPLFYVDVSKYLLYHIVMLLIKMSLIHIIYCSNNLKYCTYWFTFPPAWVPGSSTGNCKILANILVVHFIRYDAMGFWIQTLIKMYSVIYFIKYYTMGP